MEAQVDDTRLHFLAKEPEGSLVRIVAREETNSDVYSHYGHVFYKEGQDSIMLLNGVNPEDPLGDKSASAHRRDIDVRCFVDYKVLDGGPDQL